MVWPDGPCILLHHVMDSSSGCHRMLSIRLSPRPWSWLWTRVVISVVSFLLSWRREASPLLCLGNVFVVQSLLSRNNLTCSYFSVHERYPLSIEVFELGVDVFDHASTQGEGLAVDQVLDGVELVHDREVWVLVVDLDRVAIGMKQPLIETVMSPLFKFEVHDSAKHFE